MCVSDGLDKGVTEKYGTRNSQSKTAVGTCAIIAWCAIIASEAGIWRSAFHTSPTIL